MRRRDFLRWQMHGALWLAAGAAVPGAAFASNAPEIGVATGDYAAATRAAVELLGGMQTVVSPGDVVVIKPNMSFPNPPEMATTTHPLVVKELAVMCREAGAEAVRILDHPLSRVETCLERTGIAEVCRLIPGAEAKGVADPNLFVEADIDAGEDMRQNVFMRDALEADVLIAAPVAKSHGATGVSLGMKGMMGLIYERGVMHSIYDLDESIVDLNTKLTADLTVVDATRVLTTNGPFGPGKVITPRTVIASRDIVAADAYTVQRYEWYGRRIRPDQVGHIRIAHRRGLGRMDVENMRTEEVTL